MKKLLISIISFTFLTASTWQNIQSSVETQTNLDVQSGNLERNVVEFNIDGFHLISVQTPEGEMYLARLEDGASLLRAGSPDMHKYARSIVIPDDRQMAIKVLSSDFVDYENILIAPSKGNLSRLIDHSDVEYEFGPVYQQDKFFPGDLVGLEDPYILRDVRGQSVVFYPFQYNPIQKVLRVYKTIEVEVYAAGLGQINVLSRASTQPVYSKEYLNIYDNHFINYSNDTRFDYLVDHGNMLVISYGSFMETVQPLVDWKNRKGIPTEMVNISDIGSSSSTVESYVENYYNDNGLTFLLLVGDIAQIPSPSVSGSSSDMSYGCIAGNDFYAEVIVGRFSGSTPSHIATQVERSIEYERYPQSGVEWYDNALGVASNQGPGFGGYTDDDFNDFLWDTVLSDFTYDSYEGIYDGSGGTDSQGINAINTGVSLINYTGHGSISSWGNGASLSTSQINSLTNDNRLPFVITVGCNVGEFQSTNECFCEAWMRATNGGEPTGSIAHFGSTISQSWEPPMHGQYGMNLILTESYDDHLTRTIGGITTNGCMYMNDAQGSSGINETKYWTYFGDPSVPLRTAPTTEMNIVHDDVIIIGSTEFLVTTGSEGDLVALSRDGQLLASGYTDRFGEVNLELGDAATVPGEIDFVATGFNNTPYETTVMVLSPDGAYVLVNSSSLSAGFDDLIEYGESVGLSLTLENVGSDAASDISVDISTDDPYITITSASASTSYIAPNGTATVSGLSFDVAGNVPNNHNFELSCAISSGGETWASNLNFTAYAPVLDVTSIVGDLDPGASTDMSVTVVNNGGTQITYPEVSVSGDSYVTINNSSFSNAYSVEVGMEATLDMNVTISSAAPIGHLAEFTVTVLANLGDGPVTTTTFAVPVGQVTANFEAGLGSLDWDLSCSGVGCANWGVDNTEANSGSSSAQSGAIGNSQSSSISVTLDVTADGEIDFNYKVSAEYSSSGNYFYDGLEFYIDNTLKGQYQSTTSGGSPWTNVSYDVTAGEHTFKWTYVKDGGGGSTDCDNTDCADAAWIDDIVFPPAYMESDVITGDLNGDSLVNILDVIIMVNMILGIEPETSLADLNGDGVLNILDVVQEINLILGPRVDNASRAQLFDTGSAIKVQSDGYIAALKMTLIHEGLFSLELTDNAYLASYNTERNTTTIIVVAPETDHLFSYEGTFSIIDVEAASSDDYIQVMLPSRTSLSAAYPNPFNPSTTISYTLANTANINLSVYNISGQLIEKLKNGYQDAGNYEIVWDASEQPSGIYLLRLQSEHESFNQKLMLMK